MSFDRPKLEELDDWLAQREAAVGDIRAGCAKQVVWADGPKKSALSVVYVHGFSASSGEVRPLPDLVASALGANLFYTRLPGHGQDGAAMGRATVDAWHADVAEAMDIGAALGEEVIVIGCSTGCTLLTTALARGARAKAVVHLSPNFGLRNVFARSLLKMPGIEHWGHLVVGRTRTFEQRSAEQGRVWTLSYDTRAIYEMAASVRETLGERIEGIKTPAYFAYAMTDQVVSATLTQKVMDRWGGPVHSDILVQGPADDADGHVMAGEIMSPQQTAPLAGRIVAWLNSL